jgi:group I intron endonuclease
MIFQYNGCSKLGGIYQIKNTTSGGVYVGSTREFKCRWTDHKRSLITNKHKTKHLQNAYNKYLLEHGSDDFLEFSILELMENSTKQERLISEERWINKFIEDGFDLYNTNKKPTKEPIVQSVMSLEAKQKMIARRKGIRHSPATEYKPGNVPWSKENGHDENTRKLIGEKSKVMWANPEAAEKLLKSRRSEKFRKTRSRDMKESWEKTREQRLIAMNTPECIEAKMAWRKTNKEAEKKRIENSYSFEALKKRLVSLLGQEKAEKILNVDWLKSNVEMHGFKGTAGLIGVDRQTIKRWHEKLCK